MKEESVNLINEIYKKINEIKDIVKKYENKFERIEQKMETNFKYLDEKINNTKNKMISEETELLEMFSVNTSKLIENLEKKTKAEINERKIEISKLEGLNDYDKIILGNLESRISILEEESQKYIIN